MDNQMMGGKPMGGMKCECGHHRVVPIAVLLFGIAFLLEAFGVLTAEAVGIIWPILVIVAGGTMFMEGKCKCC